MSVEGNSVKFGDGPATVTGDENSTMSLFVQADEKTRRVG